jgi:hypothetical protein
MTRFAIAVLTICLISSGAFGEPPPDSRPREEQSLFFRAVLREFGAQPITDFNELLRSPEKKVLVVLGPTNLLNGLIFGGKLSRFLAAGGSAVIATDQGVSPGVASQIGVRVDGRLFTGQHGDVYRGNLIDCPLLHEVRRKERPSEPHPIFRELPPDPVVATNRPSLLFNWNPGPHYRQIAVIDAPLANRLPTIQGYRTLGVVGEFPNGGRLLVLADHSIFIDMMVQPDNHNLDFTFGVLRWLTDDGQRTEVLMIDNDVIQTSFNVSLVRPPTGPMPSIQDLLPIISQGISDFQREDRINQMIRRAVPHSTFMRSAVTILTLAILAVGTYCFLHARHRNDSRPKSANVPPTALELDETNFAESARELAADAFREFGSSLPDGSRLPPLAIGGGGPERRHWQSQLQRLWSVANGENLPTTAAGLQRVHADCQAVHEAIRRGVVQLAAKS